MTHIGAFTPTPRADSERILDGFKQIWNAFKMGKQKVSHLKP